MQSVLHLDRRALDRARLSRDPRFDGKFFIAVTSTGIYCRPICPAPSPKRTNIQYFASAAAAAEAGFRPCLRCRPEAAPGTPAWLGTSAVVRRALRLIQEGALDQVSVDELAERLGVGPRHLHRLFVRHVGASPNAVALTRRLHFAKRLLDETQLSMTEIALAAGFGSLRRFNDAFLKAYARAPGSLRTRQRAGVAAHPADKVVLRLAYRPPYDWDHVRDFFAKRAIPGVERVDERGYARTVAVQDGSPVLIHVCPVPNRTELELTVRGATPTSLYQISVTARRVFDLAADPQLILSVLEADSLLGPLVRRRPGLRLPGVWSPFECAVRAVLGQQVTVAAGRTFAARLVARAGRVIAGGQEGLTHLFPSPAEIVAADLGGLGLTGARVRAIGTLARAVLDNILDFSAPMEAVTAALAALPGFGHWTAQYIALRAFGEPDALPTADVVLRRISADGAAPLTARGLERRAQAWRPWRSYATIHLWRAAADRTSS